MIIYLFLWIIVSKLSSLKRLFAWSWYYLLPRWCSCLMTSNVLNNHYDYVRIKEPTFEEKIKQQYHVMFVYFIFYPTDKKFHRHWSTYTTLKHYSHSHIFLGYIRLILPAVPRGGSAIDLKILQVVATQVATSWVATSCRFLY